MRVNGNDQGEVHEGSQRGAFHVKVMLWSLDWAEMRGKITVIGGRLWGIWANTVMI
jgi:hypothetical protein